MINCLSQKQPSTSPHAALAIIHLQSITHRQTQTQAKKSHRQRTGNDQPQIRARVQPLWLQSCMFNRSSVLVHRKCFCFFFFFVTQKGFWSVQHKDVSLKTIYSLSAIWLSHSGICVSVFNSFMRWVLSLEITGSSPCLIHLYFTVITCLYSLSICCFSCSY